MCRLISHWNWRSGEWQTQKLSICICCTIFVFHYIYLVFYLVGKQFYFFSSSFYLVCAALVFSQTILLYGNMFLKIHLKLIRAHGFNILFFLMFSTKLIVSLQVISMFISVYSINKKTFETTLQLWIFPEEFKKLCVTK